VPTFLSHPAVPLAIGLGVGRDIVPARLLAVAAVASVVPDLDVVGLRLGIPYASQLGHRGLSHSLAFAAAAALVSAWYHRELCSPAATAFSFVFVATASHGILDAFTNGGLGVALLWPCSAERFFAPARVVQVAPLGLSALSSRGAALLASELLWVWGPCVMLAVVLRFARVIGFAALPRRRAAQRTPGRPDPE
jgi:inner membrane protein